MSSSLERGLLAHKRARLVAHFESREDVPIQERVAIIGKIERASDDAIRSDRPCVGKHWFLITHGDVCPYCDWRLS